MNNKCQVVECRSCDVIVNIKNGKTFFADKGIRMPLEKDVLTFLGENNFFSEVTMHRPSIRNNIIINPTVSITNKCNLNCEYCFAKKYRSKKDVDFEDFLSFIDIVKKYNPNFEYMKIDLTGSGEPLLRFDLVKKIHEYSMNYSALHSKMEIGFTTNGLLINKNIKKFILKNKLNIGISYDGFTNKEYSKRINETQNLDLLYKIKGLKKRIGIACTITGGERDIISNVVGFSKIANAITMKLVRPNTDSSLSSYDVEKIKIQYTKLLEFLIFEILNGDYSHIMKLISDEDIFGKTIRRVFSGHLYSNRCGGGVSKSSLTSDGNIYYCGAANYIEFFRIGNIKEGIFEEKVLELMEIQMSRSNCIDCWAKFICGGPCLIDLHQRTFNSISKDYCELSKHLISLAFEFKYIIFNNNQRAYKLITGKSHDLHYL